MIGEKYLYWLDKGTDNTIDEVVWRELYSRIGYLFHAIQMIEYNIANILAIEELEKVNKTVFVEDEIYEIKKRISTKFEELSSLTFGSLCNKLAASSYLKGIDVNRIKKLKDYRNYLAHNCFKDALLQGKLSNLEEVEIFIDELNSYEEEVIEINESLLDVFKIVKTKPVIIKRD